MEITSPITSLASVAALTQTTAASAKQQTATAPSRDYQRSMGTSASGSSSLLQNNFVQTQFVQSKYVTTTISSSQSERSFSDQMGSLLNSLGSQFSQVASGVHSADGNPQFITAYLMQHRVEDGVEQVTDDKYMDESAKNLDDIKENIDEKAQQATQPQDGGTQPQTTDAATTATTAGPTAEGAQLPLATPEKPADATTSGADTASATAQESPGQQITTATAGPGQEAIAAGTTIVASGYPATSDTGQQSGVTPPRAESVDILV